MVEVSTISTANQFLLVVDKECTNSLLMCLNLKQSIASWANEKWRWKYFHVMYVFRPTCIFGLVLLWDFPPAVGGFCNLQLYAFYSVLPCVLYWHTCAFWFSGSYCSVPAMTYCVVRALKTNCLLCLMCWCSVSTFRNCSGCAGLDIPAWREMTEQIDWQSKQPSQMVCILEDLKCWGAWDTTCGPKTNGIAWLISQRREAWTEEALKWSSLKEWDRAIVSQTDIEIVIKGNIEKTPKRWGGTHNIGSSECINTILNWPELNSFTSCFWQNILIVFSTEIKDDFVDNFFQDWWWWTPWGFHIFFMVLQKIGEKVTEDQLHDILSEVDLNRNAQVDLGEFLQVSYFPFFSALLSSICGHLSVADSLSLALCVCLSLSLSLHISCPSLSLSSMKCTINHLM